MIRPTLPGLAAVLALTCAGAVSVHAECNCPPTPSFTDALSSATYVLAAHVDDVQQDIFDPTRTDIVVTVSARWKAPVEWATTTIVAPGWSDACALQPTIGADYLFYCGFACTGVTPHQVPSVSGCSRTALLANNPDLALLPGPLYPVPARTCSWGTLKSIHR